MDKKIFDENLRMYGGRYEIGCEYFDYLLESLMDDSQAFINKLNNKNANLPEVYIDYINADRANACAFKVDNKLESTGTINRDDNQQGRFFLIIILLITNLRT